MEVDTRGAKRNPLAYPIAFLLIFAAQGGWWYLFGHGLAPNPGRVLGLPAWFFFGALSAFVFFSFGAVILFRYLRALQGD